MKTNIKGAVARLFNGVAYWGALLPVVFTHAAGWLVLLLLVLGRIARYIERTMHAKRE